MNYMNPKSKGHSKSLGGSLLSQGLSSKDGFGGPGNDSTAVPNSGNGRAVQRPVVATGRKGIMIKGRGC